MPNHIPLASLFGSFFKIGVFTFGGGYAMIPLIEREIIERRGWLPKGEFLDLLTVAQSAPGALALNTSVFVGYKSRGYKGALAAIGGVVLPSFLIILTIAIFFSHIRDNALIDAAFKGMRPVVIALMMAPMVSIAKSQKPIMLVAAALAAAALWYFNFSPIYILLVAAAVGTVWAYLITKKIGR